ncbi:Uncharacterised protein, partial [Mycoplasmopsis synoviae]
MYLAESPFPHCVLSTKSTIIEFETAESPDEIVDCAAAKTADIIIPTTPW